MPASASRWLDHRPPGNRPLVITIALVIAPPTKNPRLNGCFMLRDW